MWTPHPLGGHALRRVQACTACTLPALPTCPHQMCLASVQQQRCTYTNSASVQCPDLWRVAKHCA